MNSQSNVRNAPYKCLKILYTYCHITAKSIVLEPSFS